MNDQVEMGLKVMKMKGIRVVVAVSLIGMGSTSFLPAVKAAVGDTNVTASTSEAVALSQLTVDGVQLDQTFTPEVKTYTATVGNNVEKINLVVKSDNPAASITVNRQSVTNGTATAITLNTGSNSLLITVGDGTVTVTYQLTVTREQNGDNFLGGIQLSNGSLAAAFDPMVSSYDVKLANNVDKLTVTPLVAVKTTKLKVNGTDVTDQGVTVDIPIEKSTITLLATAENGAARTYTLQITRQADVPVPQPQTSQAKIQPQSMGNLPQKVANLPSKSLTAGSFQTRNTSGAGFAVSQQTTATQKPSVATLSSLTVSSGTWNHTFSTTDFTYHIAVGNDVSAVTITGVSTYRDAEIAVEGGSDQTVQLGNQAKKAISVVVTKDDEQKTYVLVFDKEIQQSEEATLATSVTPTSDTANKAGSVKSTTPSPIATSSMGSKLSVQTSLWARFISTIRSFFAKL